MAGSVNKVILVGNLGRDPEVKTFSNGNHVVNFTLATSDSWTDRGTGERKEKTEWHNVSIHNKKLGEIAEQYIKKGTKIYIEGVLQTRKWTTQDGAERTVTEVVVPNFKGDLTILSSSVDRQKTFTGKTARVAAKVPELDDEVSF